MQSRFTRKRPLGKGHAVMLLVGFFSFLFPACMNKTKSNRNGLLRGMYKLYDIQVQDPFGQWHEEWAADGTGYIIYDGIGHMPVQITPGGYEHFKALSENESIDTGQLRARIDSIPAEELKTTLEEFISNYVYAGNYSVSDRPTLLHITG